MKFVDLECPKCGEVLQDIDFEISDDIYCPECDTKMERVFTGPKYRVVNYSPEYAGGNDKNLYNVHDGLGGRK